MRFLLPRNGERGVRCPSRRATEGQAIDGNRRVTRLRLGADCPCEVEFALFVRLPWLEARRLRGLVAAVGNVYCAAHFAVSQDIHRLDIADFHRWDDVGERDGEAR